MEPNQMIGWAVIILIGYLLIPKHNKKRLHRAVETGGTTKTVIDGQIVEISNRTGQHLEKLDDKKEPVAFWQILLMGTVFGLFLGYMQTINPETETPQQEVAQWQQATR